MSNIFSHMDIVGLNFEGKGYLKLPRLVSCSKANTIGAYVVYGVLKLDHMRLNDLPLGSIPVPCVVTTNSKKYSLSNCRNYIRNPCGTHVDVQVKKSVR